jgi:hypothetical protein
MKPATSQARINALHRIDIPSPCTASWDQMTGNDRVRHCGDCNKNVFNLSAMREAEAAALLAASGDGELCVRFYRRQDGTVMTSDCGASAPPAYVAPPWAGLPGVASLAFAALAAAGCAPLPVLPPAVDQLPPVAIAPQPAVTVTMGAPMPTPAVAQPVTQVSVMGGRVRMGKPDVSPGATLPLEAIEVRK